MCAQLRGGSAIEDLAPAETQILVCDDEPQVGQLLTDLLSDAGYRVTNVRRGWEAVSCLAEREIHVAIVDKNLPDISGLEVIRLGLQASPDTVFLIVTAYTSLETAIEAMDLGASAYLSKPFDLEALQRRVDSARIRAGRNRLVQRALGDRGQAPAPGHRTQPQVKPAARPAGVDPLQRIRASAEELTRIREALTAGRLGAAEAVPALDRVIRTMDLAWRELASSRSPVPSLEKVT
jgi:DNA-binding response OmpR family regulator